MPQFLVSPTDLKNGKAVLTGEEAHHARDVVRIRAGDPIRLFDGAGTGFRGTVSAFQGKGVEVRIESSFREDRDTGPVLVQSLLPKEAMDWLVEKATELGVREIIPITTRRTQVRLEKKRAEEKRAHWEKTALAACKQCDRLRLPVVRGVLSLEEWLAAVPPGGIFYYGDLSPKAVPLRDEILRDSAGPKWTGIVIGPEGDFDDAEKTAMRKAGLRPVSFGSSVFRSETAAIYACSIFNYLK